MAIFKYIHMTLFCLAVDVDVAKPDEKSIMTYVAQFVKAYPDPDAAPVGGTKVGAFTDYFFCFFSLIIHPLY